MSDLIIRTTEQLVDALGGRQAVAELLSCEPHYISMWHTRGYVPTGWHLRLFLIAIERGLVIDPALFELPAGAFDRIGLVISPPSSRRPLRRRRVAA